MVFMLRWDQHTPEIKHCLDYSASFQCLPSYPMKVGIELSVNSNYSLHLHCMREILLGTVMALRLKRIAVAEGMIQAAPAIEQRSFPR